MPKENKNPSSNLLNKNKFTLKDIFMLLFNSTIDVWIIIIGVIGFFITVGFFLQKTDCTYDKMQLLQKITALENSKSLYEGLFNTDTIILHDTVFYLKNNNIIRLPVKEPITIKGELKDNNGDYVIGARIVIDGYTTKSDFNGNFSINIPRPTSKLIHVTYSKDGYLTNSIDLNFESKINLQIQKK